MSKKSKGNLKATDVISKSVDIALSDLKNLGVLVVIFQLVPMILMSLIGISFVVSRISILSRYQYKIPLFTDMLIILLLVIAIGIWTTLGNFVIIKLVHSKNNKEVPSDYVRMGKFEESNQGFGHSLNEEMTWRKAMKATLPKVGKVILCILFTFIISIAFSVILVVLVFIGGMIIAGISKVSNFLGVLLGVFGVIGIIAIVICFTIYIVFMQQGIAIHELGVWESFKNTITMVNGRLFNVFAKELLVYIIAMIAGLVLNLLNLIPFIGPIIMMIGSGIVVVYQVICNTVIFDDYDQCDRNI